MVVVVVAMEEEMEGRMVEELVAEKGGDGGWKGWERWPTMGARRLPLLLVRLQEMEKEEEKK